MIVFLMMRLVSLRLMSKVSFLLVFMVLVSYFVLTVRFTATNLRGESRFVRL